jgi:nicotinate phosphoribosyltransferase
VFSGLTELLDIISNFKFGPGAIRFLSRLGFSREFLNWLEEFQFKGNVIAVQEGEVVFPYEPCLRIEGNLIEAQLVETAVLNLINFESLIATKAARIRQAAGDRLLMDFGFRRAHGYGGIQASRSAIIGGFQKTSNTYSANRYGLEPSGTMAHSWIQSFDDEITAFRAYADLYPENCILLVDTYDTLKSGLPNAIQVAREMEEKGFKLKGIRLDSGDLAFLSKRAREKLDLADLENVQIIVSNQLDEYIISSLLEQGAPIDGFGVGTALATGKGAGALDGVYKLSMFEGTPTVKLSENIAKTTLPGKKTVYRIMDENGYFQADAIILEEEQNIRIISHPYENEKSINVAKYKKEKLIHQVMDQGEMIGEIPDVYEIAEYTQKRLRQLPQEHKRVVFPHTYRVGISTKLLKLRDHYKKKALM